MLSPWNESPEHRSSHGSTPRPAMPGETHSVRKPEAGDGLVGSPQLEEEWLAGLQRTKSALPVWLPEVDLIHPRLVTQERVPLRIGQTYIALAGFHRVPLPRSNSTPVSPSCRRNRCVPLLFTAARRFPTLYATLSPNSAGACQQSRACPIPQNIRCRNRRFLNTLLRPLLAGRSLRDCSL